MFRDEDEALGGWDVCPCGDFEDDMLEFLGKVVWNDEHHWRYQNKAKTYPPDLICTSMLARFTHHRL